jgi:hypothetical protein
VNLGQPERNANAECRGDDDANEDRLRGFARRQPGHDEDADAGQRRRGRVERAEPDQGRRVRDGEPHPLQADEAEEQPDPRPDAKLEEQRNGVDEPLAHAEQADGEEQEAERNTAPSAVSQGIPMLFTTGKAK